MKLGHFLLLSALVTCMLANGNSTAQEQSSATAIGQYRAAVALQNQGVFNDLGIILGLFLGKQLGVFGMVWLAIRTGLARMPAGASWLSLYGVSVLTGIGFTMSLFIGTLAFEDASLVNQNATRIGVLLGSLGSALLGYCVLRFAFRADRLSANTPGLTPLPATARTNST